MHLTVALIQTQAAQGMPMTLSTILESLNQVLWGLPLLCLLSFAHLFFTIYLKFPQRHLFRAIHLSVTLDSALAPDSGSVSVPDSDSVSDSTHHPKSAPSPGGFAVLATTLAATIGTGNIIGVSTAIALGGPGALFWCWLTGIFGMATSYAECTLSVRFQQSTPYGMRYGGPMYVMHYGLHNKFLAIFYSICTLLAAFGVGCTTQSNAIVAVTRDWQIAPTVTGMVTAVLVGIVIIGGIHSISSFCTKIVPLMGTFFIGCCLILLYQNRNFLLPACRLAVSAAFLPRAAMGGFLGSTLQTAARYGIARGLFTNEAGMGTAAIAAGAVHTSSPGRQGLISMTAVFWDTVIMCALTGLVILTAMLKYPGGADHCNIGGLTVFAFSYLPIGGSLFLPLCLIAFAFTTLIGWCYFGEKAMEYLFGEKGIPCYHLCYIVMAFWGAVLPMELVWEFTDMVNAIMIFPNVLTLFLLRRYVDR